MSPKMQSSILSSSGEAPEELLPDAPVSAQMSVEQLIAFRKSKEGKALVSWATSEFSRCQTAKSPKKQQWYENLAMVMGQQWLDKARGVPNTKLQVQPAPRWLRRKTINRLRPFVRMETSKFLSTIPNIVSVPSTAEDEDVRAAYAAEQVWMSYQERKKFRREFTASVWWMVLTGNGFLKTWWDSSVEVPISKDQVDQGDIAYRKVSPFHLFVPEMREANIEDQPYVIEAKVRPVSWVKKFYHDQIGDAEITPSTSSTNQLLDEGFLKASNSTGKGLDAVVVYEFWVKPGTHDQLPNGGFFVLVDDVLVDFYDGMPYSHRQFPYTKFEHLFNDTFWADSPLVDLIPLQREYNEVRTDLSVAARRMGNPQLLVQKGSIDTAKMTNEPGAQIVYRPGTAPPQPAPMAQIPQYVIEQQERILRDFEDVSGQHEISRGEAPAGITAGTALAYLGERDDNFLTPQYQSIEESVERVATQTLTLFQQYVDIKRKIKVVGLDGSYDTMLLEGADIADGTDIRVEPGSGIGQSQAAKTAQVMDLVGLGIIQPDMALKLLEIGGPQKILDIMAAAERKAQRENMKMKALKDQPELIEQSRMKFVSEALAAPFAQQALAEGAATPEKLIEFAEQNTPPVVQVDDFDIHEVHIEVHNRFRMSQEYEALPEEIKDEFDKHVKWHQDMGAAVMQAQLMEQMPPDVAAEDAVDDGTMPPTEGMTPATAAPMPVGPGA